MSAHENELSMWATFARNGIRAISPAGMTPNTSAAAGMPETASPRPTRFERAVRQRTATQASPISTKRLAEGFMTFRFSWNGR